MAGGLTEGESLDVRVLLVAMGFPMSRGVFLSFCPTPYSVFFSLFKRAKKALNPLDVTCRHVPASGLVASVKMALFLMEQL